MAAPVYNSPSLLLKQTLLYLMDHTHTLIGDWGERKGEIEKETHAAKQRDNMTVIDIKGSISLGRKTSVGEGERC